MVKAPDFESGDREFDPHLPHQKTDVLYNMQVKHKW